MDTNKWKLIPCYWIGRINIVKIAILPKAIYRLGAVPIKSPTAFFHELEQTVQKFIWKHQRSRIAKAILRRKKKVCLCVCWVGAVSRSPTSSSTTKPQSSRQFATGTRTEPRTGGTEQRLHTLTQTYVGQLLYDKAARDIQWGNDTLFNRWCWQNWTATRKRMKLDHCLTPYRKVNSKWSQDLNVSHETIKLSEKNIGTNLLDISMSDLFKNRPPRARETKAKMNWWDYIKPKSFCTAKDTTNGTKRYPTVYARIYS